MPNAAIAPALRHTRLPVGIQLQQRVRQAFPQRAVLRGAAHDPRARGMLGMHQTDRLLAKRADARHQQRGIQPPAARHLHCRAGRGPGG